MSLDSSPPSLLRALLGDASADQQIQLVALASRIDSIVSSYDDAFDQLPELIQNAFDAIETKYQAANAVGHEYMPRISVFIDESERTIAVLDNGCGVPEEHFYKVFEPGVSVKRLLKHSNARGHKGAAVVYLQFDHSSFRFDTRQGDFSRSAQLTDGNKWLKELKSAVDSDQKPAEPKFIVSETVCPQLQTYESGTFAEVKLADEEACTLFDGIFSTSNLIDKPEVAARRIEYLLRTRTAVGYVLERDKSLPPVLERMKSVHLEITFKDKSKRTGEIPIGFLYPHGDKAFASAEILNKGKPRTLELLHQQWDATIISVKDTLKTKVLSNKKHQDIMGEFTPHGYFCYSSRNTFYEEGQERFCKFSQNPGSEEDQLREYLKTTGINGGFMISVGNFPNGRLQQFIQRGGSEDKSRSFVLINFNSKYIPDYGRKSLHHDCRTFVNELCKGLMAFASDEKRGYLPSGAKSNVGGSGATGGITAARELCKEQEQQLRARYSAPPYVSGNIQDYFDPQYELDVAYQFLNLVRLGRLKGYRIFGLPSGTMLDGLFDYELNNPNDEEYDPNSNILGVRFGGKTKIKLTGQWLEFKKSADQLITDFNSPEGTMGKKWYDTVQLLVCDKIDDQFEGFQVEEIVHDNVSDRIFFGVTHLLKKSNHEHTIQVISLMKLRAILSGSNPSENG